MNDDAKQSPSPSDGDELDREAILKRRQRLVQAALGALALGTLAAAGSACACLSVAAPQDARADSSDAAPMACLSIAADAGPREDAAGDVREDASPSDAGDAQPMACLAPLPPDASDGGDAGG